MALERAQSAARRTVSLFGVLGWLLVLAGTARCARGAGPVASQSTTLRVGVGNVVQQAADSGLGNLVANLSIEGFVNFSEDGRPRPWLAEGWTVSPDGLSVTVQLRHQSKFHDGSPITAAFAAQALQRALPPVMGVAAEDLSEIKALDNDRVGISLKRPSPFVLEALETSLTKPGKQRIGTGAFIAVPGSTPARLQANADYYLGRPAIDQISFTPYPSVRTAWAELLRGNLDMLYEVNADALDSLQGSSNVAVFSFVRNYQYMIIFSPTAPSLQSAAVRRELNAAINRDAIVRAALNGHGVPSIGPVSAKHWAFDASAKRLTFDAALAKSLAARHLKFTCLVPADSVYERVALAVKQQLAAASVDMEVQETSQDQALEAMTANRFEAVLGDFISGPSIFRSYRHWYSKAPSIPKPIGSPSIDAALDRIRHAASDGEYREGVTAFQQAIVDDPPAIFLAWSERARAVSRRFDVLVPDGGRDVLATLRLWRPVAARLAASTN